MKDLRNISGQDLIRATPEVCKTLGKTEEQIKNATLRDLAQWAAEKGYTWRVSSKKDDLTGVLVRMEDEEGAPLPDHREG